MSDWTAGAVTIHACRPHEVRAVLNVLANYVLADGVVREDQRASLTVGTPIYSSSMPCNGATDMAHDLMDAVPDVPFSVYEEPVSEWLGTVCWYVPELGLFTTSCDTDGEPLFTQDFVLALNGKPSQVRDEHLGVPWLNAFASMAGEHVVTEPELFEAYWYRRFNKIVVAPAGNGAETAEPVSLDDTDPDASLALHGFQRNGEWLTQDSFGDLARADLYLIAETS